MKPSSIGVLFIDDDRTDLELLTRAFKSTGVMDPVCCLKGGEEAIEYVRGVVSMATDPSTHIPHLSSPI
jgi:CheY-like chemotaxis protein